MSHSTPATYMAWAILSSLLGLFLLQHLWKFDRFKCLRWNHGPYSGAFKRIMTYTYIITIPLIVAYSIGYAYIKYKMGWSFIPGFGIIPTPWQEWPQKYQSAQLPLNLVFSVAWSLEMVTHLEELCFWLFLVNAVRDRQDWFRSSYFRVWIFGSCVAVAYMPLVTIFTRSDPLKSEAFTFLAGSLGSLSLTLWFMPVLWTFPAFLANMKAEGVDLATVLRLTKFHELNSIRIVFRFMFAIPLTILGIDGVRPHQHINDHYFWTEFLAIIAGIGVVVSSGITLVVFFPRSAEGEFAAKQARSQSKSMRSRHQAQISEVTSYNAARELATKSWGSGYPEGIMESPIPLKVAYDEEAVTSTSFAPNRRLPTGGVAPGSVHVAGLTEGNLARHDARLGVNPYVQYYTSPIQLIYGEAL